jgi:DNA-binding NarL/FixJ family response regulator
MLEKLCESFSNKEVARALGIQEPTVKLHMKTLYRKIGIHNRTQAALIAKEVGYSESSVRLSRRPGPVRRDGHARAS